MKLACDLLLFLVAIVAPMMGLARAVIRLGTPTTPAPLLMRPKLGAEAKRGGWAGRVLRVLLMLALAAACAWLMTGCEEQSSGHSPALHGAVVGLGFFGLLGLAFLMGKGTRS